MQLRRSWLLICAEGVLLSSLSSAGAAVLMPMEEPATAMVSPSASISSIQYSNVNGTIVLNLVTGTPLLCGNTSSPANPSTPVSPIYFSTAGKALATPRPFVFGASSSSPTTSAPAFGSSFILSSYGRLTGDPALVCYGLDATGLHGPTPGVMRDRFEGFTVSPTVGAAFNSSVVVNVFHRPSSSTDYFGYTVDVTIEPLPSVFGSLCSNGVDCNFTLMEGYDSGVFATNSGQWCLAPSGTSCSSPPPQGGTAPTYGDINVNYTNYGSTVSLAAPIAPAPAKQYHFVAYRYLAAGVSSLPNNTDPLVIATLFSPNDLDENRIDDNVAVAYANTPPAVVTTGDTWSVFTGSLNVLAENTDSGALTFAIADADTTGPMSATVSLSLNGVSVPVTPSCSATTLQGQASAANCTVSIPLSNTNWWNGSASADLQGLFNTFATDVANGAYANGVSASAHIVPADSAGKFGPAVDVPLHVTSSVNNAPVIAFQSPLVNTSDPNNNHVYPTYACSVSAGNGAGGCGTGRSLIDVTVSQVVSALPGPAAAFDELAAQTTAVVPYSDPQDSFTNVQCNREQAAMVFLTNGGPIVAASATAGLYNVNFEIPVTPPSTTVSALCTVTITDQGSFPNGQTAQTANAQFRIVINP